MFSILDQKQIFWANLVQKIKIVNLSRNSVSTIIRICRIQWWCHFFCFRLETSFLGKFGPKNQNCQFKLKFSIQTKSNMQNSMVVLIFSFLNGKHSFWVNLLNEARLLPLRPYRSRNFEVGSCRKHGFFCCCSCGECVRRLFWGTALKPFK